MRSREAQTGFQVRDLIVGPPGSVVELRVDRKMGDKEEIFDVELVRAEIAAKERYTSALICSPCHVQISFSHCVRFCFAYSACAQSFRSFRLL